MIAQDAAPQVCEAHHALFVLPPHRLAMASPPDISLSLYFQDLAAAHKGKGSTNMLAWHNVFVVNQLARVSWHWHRFVYGYRHGDGVTAVHALFAFGARTYKLLCLAARRRHELPMQLRYSAFSDEVFDNLCAVALRMIRWKSLRGLLRPTAFSQMVQGQFGPDGQVSFQMVHGQFGPLRLRGDWHSAGWQHRFGLPWQRFFHLQRCASLPLIGETWTLKRTALSLRRCRSTSLLIPLETDDGDPLPL